MINIIYNGGSSSQATNMITFTDFPNILRVEDNMSYPSRAYYELEVLGNLAGETEKDGQWYITIFGETITNVVDAKNAINRNFCAMGSSISTAASIVKALRNCPNIAANFSVWNDYDTITILARQAGSLFGDGNIFDTNIPTAYLNVTGYDGQGSTLQGAKIDVDVYTDGQYVTTLEKNWYRDATEFNMSPVLTTLADYGKTVPYSLRVSSIDKDGNYALLGNVNSNYITPGYLCNQGYGVLLVTGSTITLAQNIDRGENRGYSNNTRLYTYFPNIRLSYYGPMTSQSITVTYLDSAMGSIYSYSTTYYTLNSDTKLHDISIDLNTTYFNQAFYVVVGIGNYQILYEIIKPLKATEGAQRIYWRNSYGGVSFVDMTGARSETRELDITTYQENIYDAVKATIREYKNGFLQYAPYYELNKVYNNKVDYTVTLKSHLFEEDGKWLYNDLIQSSKVWTEINNNFYEIILDNVSVEEQNNNNIYEATIRYKYSQVPSEIQ